MTNLFVLQYCIVPSLIPSFYRLQYEKLIFMNSKKAGGGLGTRLNTVHKARIITINKHRCLLFPKITAQTGADFHGVHIIAIKLTVAYGLRLCNIIAIKQLLLHNSNAVSAITIVGIN